MWNVAIDLIPWPPRSPDLGNSQKIVEIWKKRLFWPLPSNGVRLTWIFGTPCIIILNSNKKRFLWAFWKKLCLDFVGTYRLSWSMTIIKNIGSIAQLSLCIFLWFFTSFFTSSFSLTFLLYCFYYLQRTTIRWYAEDCYRSKATRHWCITSRAVRQLQGSLYSRTATGIIYSAYYALQNFNVNRNKPRRGALLCSSLIGGNSLNPKAWYFLRTTIRWYAEDCYLSKATRHWCTTSRAVRQSLVSSQENYPLICRGLSQKRPGIDALRHGL